MEHVFVFVIELAFVFAFVFVCVFVKCITHSCRCTVCNLFCNILLLGQEEEWNMQLAQKTKIFWAPLLSSALLAGLLLNCCPRYALKDLFFGRSDLDIICTLMFTSVVNTEIF